MKKKNFFNFANNTVKLAASAALAVLGFVLCWLWIGVVHGNAFGMLAIVCLAAGGVLTIRYFRQWREFGGVEVPIDVGQEKPEGKAKTPQYNSLCIYPDKAIFEDVLNPEALKAQKKRCINDGKDYYVFIFDDSLGHSGQLTPLILPDQLYMSPEKLGQQVLELPAHRRIFQRKQKLLEQLQPAFVIVGIIAVWILILTTG